MIITIKLCLDYRCMHVDVCVCVVFPTTTILLHCNLSKHHKFDETFFLFYLFYYIFSNNKKKEWKEIKIRQSSNEKKINNNKWGDNGDEHFFSFYKRAL